MSQSKLQRSTLPSKSNNAWLEGLKTLSLSVTLALGIRTFIAKARHIPSGSMEPTLQINDRLVVDKLSYDFAPPQRGDIIVFNSTASLSQQNFKDAFIKRVVGLPGETIEIKNGQVYVNGSALNEPYIAAPAKQWNPVVVPPDSYLVLGIRRQPK